MTARDMAGGVLRRTAPEGLRASCLYRKEQLGVLYRFVEDEVGAVH